VAERPLAGRTIAVTRPRKDAGPLVEGLERVGATAVVVPLISIELLDADQGFRRLVADGAYDWIVFTSANAVRAVGDLLPGARARATAVGPLTATSLRELGVEPAFVPSRFAALEIADGLEPLEGARVLLPQSEIAEPLLADELRARGAVVDVVDAYRTTARQPSADELVALRDADAILLASGSAARSLADALGEAEPPFVVCIGPSTAGAARAAGVSVGLIADEATGQGMIQALVRHFGEGT
jgi:uroporphyrinogen-III synthase